MLSFPSQGLHWCMVNGREMTKCFALENEIGAWQQGRELFNPTDALRHTSSQC